MDTGNGSFRMIEDQKLYKSLMAEKPNRQDLFSVGEEVNIKESRFRIVKITPKKMTLRLLPK
jgi:hypothetical protein